MTRHGEPGPDPPGSQAATLSQEIVAQGGSADLADKEIIALIAYMQRLGTDIKKPVPEGSR